MMVLSKGVVPEPLMASSLFLVEKARGRFAASSVKLLCDEEQIFRLAITVESLMLPFARRLRAKNSKVKARHFSRKHRW